MKKVLMVAAMLFAGLFTYCYAQDVRVNINNQDYSSQDCEYKINGICSSEDIGGVDLQEYIKYDLSNGYYYKCIYASFTNYNEFTVTVLFKDGYYGGVSSLILRKNETKEQYLFPLSHTPYSSPEAPSPYPVNSAGLIVRKLGK